MRGSIISKLRAEHKRIRVGRWGEGNGDQLRKQCDKGI